MRQKQSPKRHKPDSAEILIFIFFYNNGPDHKYVDLDFLNGGLGENWRTFEWALFFIRLLSLRNNCEFGNRSIIDNESDWRGRR